MLSTLAGLSAGLGLAAAALVLPGCSGDSGEAAAPPGPPPVAVEVVRLRSEPFTEVADLLGELHAPDSVLIKPEIAGIVESVEFEEGQEVEKGAILFRLRDAEQHARLDEARARGHLAEDQYKRTRLLASRNAAAEAELERMKSQLEVARALESLREVQLARTEIRAPFDGVVGARLISQGARVEPEDALVRIEAIDPLELVFTIPEWSLPLAHMGSEFELEVAAYPGRRFPGAVSFVAPSVDTANRRILIKGRVPNTDKQLLPGMFARVEAELGSRDAILLPEEAIVNDQRGTFVWRVDAQGVAERADVELGSRTGGRVEVRTGLSAGDVVVSAGTHKVRAGNHLKTVEVSPDPATETGHSAAALPGGDA
jgi:membrane fusion protein, multidrug efflux system